MNTVFKRGLGVVALTVAFAIPAHAQPVSQASVVSACTVSANACIAAQNGFVASLRDQGLTPAQIGTAVGTLIAALVNSASVSSAIVAAAAQNSVQYATSTAQSNAFTQIAEVANSGGTVSQDVIQLASSSSPN